MISGKVLWFDVGKGYGFIRADSMDVFVHFSKIVAPEGEFKTLDKGDTVEFEMFMSERGNGVEKPQARNVKIVTKGDVNEIQRENKTGAFRGHDKRPEADAVL